MERTARVTHDSLDYLPVKSPTEYNKGGIIYSGNCASLYLIGSGRVKVSRVAADGCEATLRIVAPDGFFGECASIGADGTDARRSLRRSKDSTSTRLLAEHTGHCQTQSTGCQKRFVVHSFCNLHHREIITGLVLFGAYPPKGLQE
jgi:hypothetical protein